MTENISYQELIFEALSEGNLPSHYDCGDDDLDDFIVNDALNHQNANVAMTTLVRYKGEIVGFYSLANDCISLDKSEKNRIKKQYNISYTEFPALKICRLGVRKDYQNKGIGKAIVSDVAGFAQELQNWIGLRFVSVDAYKASEGFYTHLGFLVNNHEDEIDPKDVTISMRLDLQPVVWQEE